MCMYSCTYIHTYIHAEARGRQWCLPVSLLTFTELDFIVSTRVTDHDLTESACLGLPMLGF